MFVLIVARNFPTIETPMTGIFEYDQARALNKIGHKIIFLSLDLRSLRRRRKLGKQHLTQDGIEIYSISLPVGLVPAWLFIFLGKLALRLICSDIFKEHGRPDIVHAHFSNIGSIAAFLKTKYHIPLIVTEHSSKINSDQLNKRTRHFCLKAFKHADNVIAVSSKLSLRLSQHFNIQSSVIHNIVDTEIFKLHEKDHNSFTFVSVGNLIPQKNFDLLIEAFARIQNNIINLFIIGEGPEYNILKNKIERLNLSEKISLLGRKSRYEINEIMKTCHAFVLPSQGETFGVAYIEALAAGLPVIATKCGGPEEYITEENGILVSLQDVEQLIQAMIYMYSNIRKYDRNLIMKRCRELFSPSVIASKLTELYAETLRNT